MKYGKCILLLDYISFFEGRNIKFFALAQGNPGKDLLNMPFYTYHEGVREFIEDFAKTEVTVPDYLQIMKPYLDQRQDFNELIRSADFKLLWAVLTYFVQGEEYCEGFWAGAIEKRYFVNILYRLRELLEEESKSKAIII